MHERDAAQIQQLRRNGWLLGGDDDSACQMSLQTDSGHKGFGQFLCRGGRWKHKLLGICMRWLGQEQSGGIDEG